MNGFNHDLLKKIKKQRVLQYILIGRQRINKYASNGSNFGIWNSFEVFGSFLPVRLLKMSCQTSTTVLSNGLLSCFSV